jgi:hypothetical protein
VIFFATRICALYRGSFSASATKLNTSSRGLSIRARNNSGFSIPTAEVAD